MNTSGAASPATNGHQGPTIAAVSMSHSPKMSADVDHREGLEFRAGVAQVVKAVAAYDPTLVVYFGPDHLRALAGIAPCFTVVEQARGYGDWGTPEEDYDVPRDRAVELTHALAGHGIDIACADSLRLDHGFGQSTEELFGSLSAVPMVPIVINCVDRPIATAARTAALGAAVGEWLRGHVGADERVLVVGSGGLSHTPPSLVPGARDLSEPQRQQLITDNIATAAEAINTDWDYRMLAMLASAHEDMAGLNPEDLAPGGGGGQEIRTWIASAFACARPLQTVAYQPVPEWITGMGIAASKNLLGA
ncbi:hypothetical protein [Actinomycetospora sp. CA-084318]|uniref:DODA-type extradiol aromatic ring-opening family dioxygenase n=1 Tax=Actinomycetospora sp. CA-084318 TaxID=3239892 RepID=UPI003D951388